MMRFLDIECDATFEGIWYLFNVIQIMQIYIRIKCTQKFKYDIKIAHAYITNCDIWLLRNPSF